MHPAIVGPIIAALCLAPFGERIAVAQESAALSNRAFLETYCRIVSLSVSPRHIQTNKGSIRFRLLLTENEIYKSFIAECIEFAGTEGNKARLRYSVRLESEKFVGGAQPGYEGIDIAVIRWESAKCALCKVGSDLYTVTFASDPKKIAVELARGVK
jgi:hypothetical protein